MRGKYCYVLWSVIVCSFYQVPVIRSMTMMEVVEECCSYGELAAEEVDPTKCDVADVPEDMDANMLGLCKSSATLCCTNRLKSSEEDCQTGQREAVQGASCEKLETEKARLCCEECKVGRFAGSTGGEAACKDGKGAFRQCCMKVASESNEKNDTKVTEPNINNVNPVLTTSATTVASIGSSSFEPSICEQFAPDELCAHHCISVPGSYRCECNSGFVLMSDGKSCKKMEFDRCKPSNPCEQKCLDTGKEIKCLCRRGYELMDDLKSCIDVDECILHTHTCKQNQKCVNTIGSYKCKSSSGSEDQTNKRNPPVKTCPTGFIYNRQNQVCDDVDECLEKSNCPETSLCTNLIGSFKCSFDASQPVTPMRWNNGEDPDDIRCPPGFKYKLETEDCIDVDECVEGLDDCNRQSQICLNTHGRFACQDKVSKTNCPPGFKINPANASCEDINECLESSELCAKGTECVNEPGGYDCKRIQATPMNRSPTPTPPRRTGSGIIPPTVQQERRMCPPGFRQFPTGCQEIDECAEGSHTCDLYQECENTRGSYICKCKPGFKLDNFTLACVDINECEDDRTNACLDTQRCDNTIGSYQCVRFISCGTGYTLNVNSGTCEDNDECSSGQNDCSVIGRDFYCVNLPGTFRCLRLSTPSTMRSTTLLNRPYDNGESPDGSYYYDEVSGEHLDYVDPQGPYNVSEHSVNSSTDSAPNSSSTAVTVPDRILTTPATKIDSNTRKSITVNASALLPNQWNYLGIQSPEKHCIQGYIMNVKGDCIDIDECISQKHICNPQTEQCVNKIGSFVCNCKPGFVKDKDSGTCGAPKDDSIHKPTEKVTTPAAMIPPYTSPERAVLITPTAVSRYQPHFWASKSCDGGYEYDAGVGTCIDIDECKEKTVACAPEGEMCVNTQGGYRCECLPGWTIDHIRQRCVSQQLKPQPGPIYRRPGNTVIEVQTYPRPAPSGPANNRRTTPKAVIPSRCSKGFTWDGRHCIDIDECLLPNFPCEQTQICTNIVGGYICRCPIGHKIVANRCVDIDECVEYKGKACSHNSRCINTVGSYRCECGTGFEQTKESDRMCQDKDECASGEAGCEDICINVWGSFRCACRNGFKLSSNNKTCNDVDECTEFADRNICIGECINEPGSYSCGCPSGYRLAADNRNCIDIDECDVRDGALPPCSNLNQVCQNTRGGYKCYSVSCPNGYIKQDTSKNRCIRAPNACLDGLIDCSTTPDTYSFNFITFVSRLYIPSPPKAQVDLFTMRGPTWPGAELNFSLRLLKADAPPSVREPATLNSFLLTSTQQQAMVSLVKSLQGPQDIELELVMELFTKRTFEGTAVAKIFIYVSPYEF